MQRERAIDRANKGVRRGFHGSHNADGGPKHLAAACCHAHGVFFDALPNYTHPDMGRDGRTAQKAAAVTIKSGPYRITPGDPWNDRNVGSAVYHLWYSEACDCGSDEWLHQEVKVDERHGYMNIMG